MQIYLINSQSVDYGFTKLVPYTSAYPLGEEQCRSVHTEDRAEAGGSHIRIILLNNVDPLPALLPQ